jgi:hypothetical protein
MPVSARIEPLGRDLQLILDSDLSPAARSKVFAEFARVEIEKAKDTNRKALGRVPPYKVAVDGTVGAALTSVKPDGGTITAEFELLLDAVAWIDAELMRHSPRRSGLYGASHRWFADGVPFDPKTQPPAASAYIVLNTQPYARKIERGHSNLAPNGVYEVVAALAARRFGNLAYIRFTYQTPIGPMPANARASRDARRPAIRIAPR